jgi:hypothetical protein
MGAHQPQPGVFRQLAITISYISTFVTHNLLVAKKLPSEIGLIFIDIVCTHAALFNQKMNLSTTQRGKPVLLREGHHRYVLLTRYGHTSHNQVFAARCLQVFTFFGW